MKTLFKYYSVAIPFRYIVILVLASFLSTASIFAQSGNIAGVVYKDFNFNGNQDEYEYGLLGVIVKAYGSNDQLFETITNADGYYKLSDLSFSNISYRVEFHMPENLSEYRYTVRGAHNNSNVRFIHNTNESVNLGVSMPEDFCEPNPKIGMSCFIDGSYADATIYDYGYATFDYDKEGIPGGVNYFPPDHPGSTRELGAVYGSAYCPKKNVVYTAAVMKRHAGLGELGPGGLYEIDLNRTTYPGKVKSLFTIEGKKKPDGSLVETGGNFERDMSIPGFPTKDTFAYAAAVKSSIGDIEVTWDGSLMYIVNLYESEVLVYNMLSNEIIKVYAFDMFSCNNGKLRPFGLNLRGNSLFVGAVCTAEESEGTTEDLSAIVFEIKGDNEPEKIIEFPLNYNRNNHRDLNWHVWRDEYKVLRPFSYHEQSYPQPVLGDIEFVEDGSMILGIVDRYGFQTGYTNMNMYGQVEERGIPLGDIIKVCNINGEWKLEGSDEGCMPKKDVDANDNGGPNGREFYDDESLIHDELSMGSLAVLPGSGQLLNTVVDPIRFDAFGVSFMDNVTGKCVKRYEVGHEISTFLKGQALGDLEVFCGLAPLEIGNYVWLDENSDGIQDADEPPIANCEVCLHNSRGDLLGCVYTDSSGLYSIGNESIGDSVLGYNRQYFISIGQSGQFDVTTGLFQGRMELTAAGVGTGDFRNNNDSDGFIAPKNVGRGILEGLPVAEIYINRPGDIEHGCDFGFRPLSAKIGNQVWLDNNHNGIQEEDEKGLENFEITLLDYDLLPLETTYTNADGKYEFTLTQSGTYYLQLDTNRNFMFAIMEHDTLDQDYRFSTRQRGRTVAIYVDEGEQDLLWDFAVTQITIDTIVFAIEEDSMVLCIPDSLIDHNGQGAIEILKCQIGTTGPIRWSYLAEGSCFNFKTDDTDYFVSDTLCYVSCYEGVCDTTLVVINAINKPVANDDYYTLTNINDVHFFNVLQNDSDRDGDSIVIVEIISPPGQGDAYINAENGNIEYAPYSGFLDMDSLVYRVCDVDINGNSPKDGCDEAKAYIFYESTTLFDCFVPEGITPNGDGKNDYFEIECLEFIEVNPRLQVYNRWGQMVYTNDNYKNDWNGTFNGKTLASGTYFYNLTVSEASNELKSQAGSLEIRR